MPLSDVRAVERCGPGRLPGDIEEVQVVCLCGRVWRPPKSLPVSESLNEGSSVDLTGTEAFDLLVKAPKLGAPSGSTTGDTEGEATRPYLSG